MDAFSARRLKAAPQMRRLRQTLRFRGAPAVPPAATPWRRVGRISCRREQLSHLRDVVVARQSQGSTQNSRARLPGRRRFFRCVVVRVWHSLAVQLVVHLASKQPSGLGAARSLSLPASGTHTQSQEETENGILPLFSICNDFMQMTQA